ncbi:MULTISPECIES: ornithine cyclodeaminase family protein [Cupriavidus]|uniref:Ornithine cyclodeaminase family protein n=1 Tax=Cupriavidus pauculus TaxID=82633 RepID=A0A5P2HDX2_9BURK|nr:ornithine cyclodeaminase family protein [Cupriavidus pauculus]QET06236.1 ornithine cyclodeaminase family protein [Cupriavidus pauculus]
MPADAQLLLLDKHAVESLLNPDDVLRAVREAFTLHSDREGRVFPVIREPLHTGGVFGIKAGDVPAQDLLGFKAAGFWPSNRQQGGEPHQATILLIDPATGRPVCMIDGNAITTARTGAAGGIGLQALARPDSTSLCVFGTGVQARVQAAFALRRLPSLRTVRYVSHGGTPDPAFEAAIATLAAGIAVSHDTDGNRAVAGSDIVITATPGRGPLFDADALQPGTHINAVGTDTRGKRELPAGVLERAIVVADDREQSVTIGERQWAPGVACTEIGDLLTGKASLARQPGDITVFDMTGLALQDLTVGRMIHERAMADGVGCAIAWPW